MLEQNNIYQGDCLELMRHIPDKSVDLIVTDPPYRIITGGTPVDEHKRPRGVLEANKDLFSSIPSFKDWIPMAHRILKEGSHCYVFVNFLNLSDLLTESVKAGFRLHNLLVCEKNNCTPSQYYMKNCEYVLFMRKGRSEYINNIGASKTVHKFCNIIGKKQHPTEKPCDLIEFYIKNSSVVGGFVFDPFMGSGTTAIAAINTGRNWLGIEKDEKYYQVALERIEKRLRGE